MAIAFNSIPVLLRTPGAYTEYDASRAIQGLAALPTKILVIGSMDSAAGDSAENTLQQILGRDEGIARFGQGTQLAHMLDKVKRANASTEVWAIGLDDDGAAAESTWTITIAGAATEDGTLHLLLGGRQVNVGVTSGDAFGAVATAVDAAIVADDDLAFVQGAAVAGGVVTVDSRHAGAFTDDLDVRINYYDRQRVPAGLTVTIAQTANGTTNPDITTILDALPDDEWYTTIITGWTDSANMTALETYALEQWGPLVQQDVMVIGGAVGTFSDLSTLGSGRNSQFSSIMGGGQSPTPAYEWAAVYGAVEAFEPDPARPRQTLFLPNVLPASREQRMDQAERNLLLYAGIATHTVDQSGKVSIERAITTYQTNALGIDDPTFLDITTLRTLSALRYTLNVRIQLKYPRHKLASDGTIIPPGQPIVTPSVIRGETIALFDQWAEQGWVEGGSKEQFKAELVVERNASDVNRVDAQIPPDLMNQFRVFAGQIQFLL